MKIITQEVHTCSPAENRLWPTVPELTIVDFDINSFNQNLQKLLQNKESPSKGKDFLKAFSTMYASIVYTKKYVWSEERVTDTGQLNALMQSITTTVTENYTQESVDHRQTRVNLRAIYDQSPAMQELLGSSLQKDLLDLKNSYRRDQTIASSKLASRLFISLGAIIATTITIHAVVGLSTALSLFTALIVIPLTAAGIPNIFPAIEQCEKKQEQIIENAEQDLASLEKLTVFRGEMVDTPPKGPRPS